MNSFYYFLYSFSNKKHRHLVKNDALGVIYNLNVKRKIIIQFTAFVVKKNAPEGDVFNSLYYITDTNSITSIVYINFII